MLKNIKEYVANRKLEIKEQVEKLVCPPSLLIIQTGDNEASNRYVKNKMKDCNDVGIHADVIKMYSTEDYRARWITESLTKHYQGVIVQLPSQIKNLKRYSMSVKMLMDLKIQMLHLVHQKVLWTI